MSGITSITSTGIYTGTSLLFHNYGNYNTFIGEDAGNITMTGNGYNTVIGVSSMYNNLSGERNSTVGYASLISNTTGDHNSAFGGQSLASNKIGNSNTALGYNACKNAYLDPTYGVYIGSEISSSVTGTSDTSRASVYNEIVIGANATGHGSNTSSIGNSSVTNNYFYRSVNVLNTNGNDYADLGVDEESGFLRLKNKNQESSSSGSVTWEIDAFDNNLRFINNNVGQVKAYLKNDGTMNCELVGVVASSFGSSSGYIKYANGLIMQWGYTQAGGQTVYFNTNATFTETPVIFIQFSNVSSTEWTGINSWSIYNVTTTSFTSTNRSEKTYWLAIGH